MEKDNAEQFKKIEHAWRKWSEGFEPYHPELMLPVSFCTTVAVFALRISVNSYWGAGLLITLWLIYVFWMLTRKWEPILNRHLHAYQPVDRQAYAELLKTIQSFGKLDKSALGEWIAAERKVMESHSCLFRTEQLKMKPLSKALKPWLWLLVPLTVYLMVASVSANLINKGLQNDSWGDWRIRLLIMACVFIFTAVSMKAFPDERSVIAGASAVPWIIYGVFAVINMFMEWQIGWPPVEWFDITTISSCTAPAVLAFAFFCFNH